jgi:LCP family protein required for cell wall assembly
VDTQGSGYVDPADQWVLDPVSGTYQLRLDPAESGVPAQPEYDEPAPDAQHSATEGEYASPDAGYADPVAGYGGPDDEYATADAEHSGETGPDSVAAEPGPTSQPAEQPANHPAPHPPAERPPGSRRAPSGRAARRAAANPAAVPSRRKPKQKKPKTLLWTAGTIALAAVAGGIGGYFAFRHSPIDIHTVDVGNAGSNALPASGPVNLLVIGTDSQAGLGHEYGAAAATGQADTLILLHLAADRSNATAVSIPPDLITTVPDCPVGGAVVKGAPKQPVSAVLAGRDPGCAMRLVKQLTGVPVDHFLMVDYAAVKTLSTEVGGVSVCLSKPLSDPRSHLSLGAGTHTVEGDQALALVRTRQALPGGSDLARVQVQEQFLAALFGKVKSAGSLTDPEKTLALARTAAQALTVDTPIGSVGALSTLAGDLGKVDPKHFTFAALPVRDASDGKAHGTVVIDQAKATRLFTLVKDDTSLSLGPVRPDPKLVGPKATPHDTRVLVHNGTGTFGASQDVLNWLQNDEGVNRSTNGGDAPSRTARTTLKYAPNQADQARSLAAMMGLPASALIPGTKDAAPLANMTLTLGADYTAPGTPIAPPTTPPKGLKTITAAGNACVG